MTDENVLEQRVNDLEALIAHQDLKLDEMSETIAGQWEKIDALTRKTQQLSDRLSSIEGDLHAMQPGDQPPPHY